MSKLLIFGSSLKMRYQSIFAWLFFILTALCPFGTVAQHAALLQECDESFVCDALGDEIPDLAIQSIKLISAGWNNLVADVNDEWIFRFPLSESLIYTLEREKLLLDRLGSHISMQIPKYEYIGQRIAFVGYRKIRGDALSEELYLQLSSSARQQIAESLALFLTELHHAIPLKEVLQLGYSEYHLSLDKIECSSLEALFSIEIRQMIEQAFDYAKRNPPSPQSFVLLHTDFHGGNLAYDANTQKVIGVFDFSDIAIGNYAIEFGKLFSIHQDLAVRTLKAYAALNSIEVSLKDAAVDYILRRVLYILDAREDNLVSHEKILMQLLEGFLPIWNELYSP